MTNRRLLYSTYLPIFVLALFSITLYFNSLYNGFVVDDTNLVLNNRWITDIRYLPDMFFSMLWGFNEANKAGHYYRPLMHVVFMIQYFIFGYKPWGYHLTNIVVHFANSAVAFFILRSLLTLRSEGRIRHGRPVFSNSTLALMGALLMSAHPAKTEVVNWVSAMSELGFTFFLLLSFYLYIKSAKGRNKAALAISVVAFFPSALFKETAMALPIFILAFDLLYPNKNSTGSKRPIRYLPYIFVIFLYFGIRTYALHGIIPDLPMHPYLSGPQYFINIFPLFIQQIRLIIVPVNLSTFHVFNPVYGLSEPSFLLSVIATIIIFAIFFQLRKIERLYPLSFIMILAPLLPALYIPMLDRNPFAERYIYLSGVGFALFSIIFVTDIAGRLKNRHRVRVCIIIVFLITTALYSQATFRRNREWKNLYTLWRSAVKTAPNNYYATNELASVELSRGDYDKAIPLLKQSIQLNRSRKNPDPLILGRALLSLASAYRTKNMNDSALKIYEEIITMAPRHFVANYYAGVLNHKQGRYDRALKFYAVALKNAPDKESATGVFVNIGNIYAANKNWQEAIKMYESALKYSPQDALARKNLSAAERRLNEQGQKMNAPR